MPGQRRIVLLDADRVVGQCQHLGIRRCRSAERLASVIDLVACRRADWPSARRSANCLLPSERRQHRAMALPEGRLVDVELVGIDLALHDVLAQPVGAGDEHHVAKARLGVEGEDHAAGCQVGAHHLHHADRQSDLEMVEAVVDAVDDGAVGEHRGEAAPARLEQVAGAADVQDSSRAGRRSWRSAGPLRSPSCAPRRRPCRRTLPRACGRHPR